MSLEYLAFSDESGSGRDRYRSLALITGTPDTCDDIRQQLTTILNDNSLEYLEWKEIGGDSKRQGAAEGFLKVAVNGAVSQKFRVDILTWDCQDSRHAIPGQNDVANIERMYYKIFRHTGQQWGQPKWRWYPDQSSALDWRSIKAYIERTRARRHKPYFFHLFDQDNEYFNILELKECNSKQEPLVQLADIFAGMSRFSIDKSNKLVYWMNMKKQSGQPMLFPVETANGLHQRTRSEEARFELIAILNKLCKRYRLGVSIETKRYLWTPDPKNPINFWSYEAQSKYDKAPIKER